MSVSVTTRAKRPNEVEGKDYYFVTPERFEAMVKQDAFLEHATVFKHRYGTPKDAVYKILDEGRDVLFDIDWQGAQQLSQKAKDDLVRVFILPPSRAELERRLAERRRLDREDLEELKERVSQVGLVVIDRRH